MSTHKYPHRQAATWLVIALSAGTCGCTGLSSSQQAQASRYDDKNNAAIRAAERSGHANLAIRLASQLLDASPEHVETRATLARLWLRTGKDAEAEHVLAAASDRTHPLIQQELGRLALHRNQGRLAQQHLENVARTAPALPDTNRLLGVALDLQGKGTAAQEQYRFALALNDNEETRIDLAYSLLAGMQPDQAAQVLEPLLQRSSNPALYALMCTALARSGNMERARELARAWLPPAALAAWLAQESPS